MEQIGKHKAKLCLNYTLSWKDTLSWKVAETELFIIVVLFQKIYFFSVLLMNLKDINCVNFVNFLPVKCNSPSDILLQAQPIDSKVPPKVAFLFAT